MQSKGLSGVFSNTTVQKHQFFGTQPSSQSNFHIHTCNVGDLGSIPGLGRSPGGGHGNPLQDSRLENPHGQRSLVGYSPQGHKELDTIEQLRFLSMLPSGHPWWLSGKESACSARDTETQVLSLDREDPLEKEIATHSSIITWENPWTEKSGGLQFLGLQRVGHD